MPSPGHGPRHASKRAPTPVLALTEARTPLLPMALPVQPLSAMKSLHIFMYPYAHERDPFTSATGLYRPGVLRWGGGGGGGGGGECGEGEEELKPEGPRVKRENPNK